MGDVAERWYQLGEADKAKALFAEGLQIAGKLTDKADVKRGWFAARLARVDLSAALAIAKDFDGDRSQARVLGSIVLRLVDQNPAEAERIWAQTGKMPRGLVLAPTLCWKLAGVDPPRARRVIEGLAGIKNEPEQYFFLCWGQKREMKRSRARPFRPEWKHSTASWRNDWNGISILPEHSCRSSSESTRARTRGLLA